MIKSYNKPRALGHIKAEVIICLTLEIHLQVEVSKGHPKFPVLKKIFLIRAGSLTGVIKVYSIVWSAAEDYVDTQTLKRNSFA